MSLYGPGTDSGTFDYFTDVINGEEGVTRKEYQASEDDNTLVTGIEGDTGGSGYFGFSYYEQNADALNLVSVDDGNGCVAPSAETIQDGSYAPLSRPIFMYPSTEAMGRPEVAGFMQYVVDNYDTIAEAALIVPMDETQALRGGQRGRGSHGLARVEAGSHALAGAAPGISPSASRSARRGEQLIKALLSSRRRDLGPDDDPHPRRALEGGNRLLRGRRARLLHRADWAPLFGERFVRDLAAAERDLPDHRDRDPGRGPDRSRRPRSTSPSTRRRAYGRSQADSRGPRRRADRGLRLLRPRLCHTDDPAGHPRAEHRDLQRSFRRLGDGHS